MPEGYFQGYLQRAEDYVKKCGGVLHERKYTEYSRLIIALTAIGENPKDFAGYNLLIPLGDFEKTVQQGINGAIWALIALDCGDYEMPDNQEAAVQATREMYLNHILKNRTADGGWALAGDKADGDITGMALQALSKYRDNEEVRDAIDNALSVMSANQNADGGFSSQGEENSECAVQMAVALSSFGISSEDSRFVKNGNTILDNLMTYYVNGGGFKHIRGDSGANQMATEQCFYALTAAKRFAEGKPGLYSMTDSEIVSAMAETGEERENSIVKKTEVLLPGKTFSDIQSHENQTAIEALAERNIINGKTESTFEPESFMTRAEFAAVITRGLGLPTEENMQFTDVTPKDWFFASVGAAYGCGIIKGTSEALFNPYGTVTREEAAVMIARAASLCGVNTEVDEPRNILAEFSDYVKAADWAKNSLAFCCREEILPRDVMELKPNETVSRGEIAQMIYNMLKLSGLL